MSEQPAERLSDDGRAQVRRPAPPGYGRPLAAGAGDAQGGTETPLPRPQPGMPDLGGNPVYGRVTRFGGPVQPAAQPVSAWPPPAPYGSAPALAEQVPGPAAPGSPPPPGYPPATVPGLPVGQPWTPSAPWLPPTAWAPAPAWRHEDYASWPRRVGGFLLDHVPDYVAATLVLISYVPLYTGLLRGDLTARPTWWLFVLGLLLTLASVGWTAYNRWVVAGRTGQSLGKRATRTWLVSADDARPVGVLNAFLRDLLHIIDGAAYVGYLWPLWDDQRQTLADKVIRTVVVRTPVPPLTDHERGARA